LIVETRARRYRPIALALSSAEAAGFERGERPLKKKIERVFVRLVGLWTTCQD
jgi:hypothetical protein